MHDPTWPHGPQPTRAPILLGDAGCPGRYLPVRGHTAPLCLSCSRYGVQTAHQLKPAADMQPGGEWFCPERRSAGVHEPEHPANAGGGEGHVLGGTLGSGTQSVEVGS